MRVIGIEQAILGPCINIVQHERVIITRQGKPIALIVGVEGMDPEQLDLASNPHFGR